MTTREQTPEEAARMRRIAERIAEAMPQPVKFRYFQTGNGPMFAWTVEKIDGKYQSYVYRPKGKGARTDKAEAWELIERGRLKPVKHAKRKAAKARAWRLYQRHMYGVVLFSIEQGWPAVAGDIRDGVPLTTVTDRVVDTMDESEEGELLPLIAELARWVDE